MINLGGVSDGIMIHMVTPIAESGGRHIKKPTPFDP
jgi:hypothetical protein